MINILEQIKQNSFKDELSKIAGSMSVLKRLAKASLKKIHGSERGYYEGLVVAGENVQRKREREE
jgi:hypothetical protein